MSDFFVTNHGEQRTAQRGFTRFGISAILEFGEIIGDSEVLMTDREISARIIELKSEIQRLDKLKNRKLVIDGSAVITGYCLTKKAKRKYRIRRRTAEAE